MTGYTDRLLEKIARSLEKIADKGIDVHIKFPDVDDKFVTDLPAMKISESINEICSYLGPIESAIDEISTVLADKT